MKERACGNEGIRMTEGAAQSAVFVIGISGLGRHSDFVIRHLTRALDEEEQR
jgi:mannitol/fructose-specific phosphotransferase system IIA component